MVKVFNSLGRKKEILRPLKDKKLGFYVCGPTVYGPSHLGHARTYIVFDFIRRFLEYLGYKIIFVMNITDIHDDIITKARQQNIRAVVLAKKYEAEFFKDLEVLRIKKPDFMPKVSGHVKEIKELIKKILKNKFAYQTADGIYFRILKFKDYGKLSGVKVGKEKTGTRVKTDKYEKNQVFDFALWKKEKGREIFQSPWGEGRPGWHIECSAMSMKYLGQVFDIHAGAKDLIFPHHENEIAQSRSATGRSLFVKYWLHSGILTVKGRKMAKSLGNFISVDDVLKKYQPRVLRFFILRHLWRNRVDFDYKKLEESKNILKRLDNFTLKLKEKTKPGKNKKVDKLLKGTKNKVIKFLEDDFNTPKAIAQILSLVRGLNKIEVKLNKGDNQLIFDFFKDLDKFFLWLLPWAGGKAVPRQISDLVKIRESMRKSGDFKKADEIRLQLKKLGYKIEDTKEGARVVKIYTE